MSDVFYCLFVWIWFIKDSVDMSVNIGWDGGVFVTTCGHHLHLDCQRSYVDALRVSAFHWKFY